MTDTPVKRPQCEEIVYVKDCYRRTGRGPTGFEMHYNRQQCSRNAQEGRKFCWQHPYATYRAGQVKKMLTERETNQ